MHLSENCNRIRKRAEKKNERKCFGWCCQKCILHVRRNISSEYNFLENSALRSHDCQITGEKSVNTERMIFLSIYITTEKNEEMLKLSLGKRELKIFKLLTVNPMKRHYFG